MEKWSEMRVMTVGLLEIDLKYQRSLDLAWTKEIVKNFDPHLVGIVYVSVRKGHYYVFDGQHTLKALEILYHDKNYPVLCRVYHGLTEQDEARMFCEFNQRKKRISSLDIMKARAISGDDSTMNFLRCTKEAGFIVDPTKKFTRRYGINAVKKAQTCFLTLGAEKYSRMLKLIGETWNGEPWSVSQKMLAGMTVLFKFFDLNSKNFVRRMSGVTELEIERMSQNFYNLSMPYRYAWAIGKMHNRIGGKKCLDLIKLNFVNDK